VEPKWGAKGGGAANGGMPPLLPWRRPSIVDQYLHKNTNCLVEHPTLAGRHKQNHHAAKPN